MGWWGRPQAWRARGALPLAKFSGQDRREQPLLEGFVAGGERASVSAPSQTWKLVSLSVCLSAPWSDRSWEEAAGSVRGWHCVPAGHCGRQAAFKDCRQQVPVIESRGMVFPHYRKPGMLLGDLFALRGKFLAKSKRLLARPGHSREASEHQVPVCSQMWAPDASGSAGPGTRFAATAVFAAGS